MSTAGPRSPRIVSFDLMPQDPDYYFVLTEALGDFAARQRSEAEGPDTESRIRWAETAEAALDRIEKAMSGGEAVVPALGTDAIVKWSEVRSGDLVLLDDCLVTAERAEVVRKPWGDGTDFTAVDIYQRLDNGVLVSSERHGDRFTAVRRPVAAATTEEGTDAAT